MRPTTIPAAALAILAACSSDVGIGPVPPPPDERVPPPQLLAAIDGPSCLDRPGTYTFSAVVQPWSTTYDYAWLSTDAVEHRSIGAEQRVLVRFEKNTDEVRLELRVFGPGGAFGRAEKTVKMRRDEDEPVIPEVRLGADGPVPCGN